MSSLEDTGFGKRCEQAGMPLSAHNHTHKSKTNVLFYLWKKIVDITVLKREKKSNKKSK
jgi:hypothetical protein